MYNSIILSIIIANFNNEKYLKKCLDSVLGQTYKNIEIIIFDDFSTDNSRKILNTYEEKFPNIIKVVYSDKNIGVARARHEAILQASGKYITTLDSDDFYFDDKKLEKEMELIKKYRNQNKDIIAFSRISLVNVNGEFIDYQFKNQPIKEGIIINDLITRACFIPRDFILRKDLYSKTGGFDFNIPIYEDWDLKIRLSKENEFYFTKSVGTAYRRHSKGLSSKNYNEHIKWINYIFNKNYSLINIHNKGEVKKNFDIFISNFKNKRK